MIKTLANIQIFECLKKIYNMYVNSYVHIFNYRCDSMNVHSYMRTCMQTMNDFESHVARYNRKLHTVTIKAMATFWIQPRRMAPTENKIIKKSLSHLHRIPTFNFAHLRFSISKSVHCETRV